MPWPVPVACLKLRDINKREFHFPSRLETNGLLNHSSSNDGNWTPSSFKPNIAKYMMLSMNSGEEGENKMAHKNHHNMDSLAPFLWLLRHLVFLETAVHQDWSSPVFWNGRPQFKKTKTWYCLHLAVWVAEEGASVLPVMGSIWTALCSHFRPAQTAAQVPNSLSSSASTMLAQGYSWTIHWDLQFLALAPVLSVCNVFTSVS